MSKKTKNIQASISKWMLMLIFPPFGFYYFIFKSKVKWFVKIPVSLILVVVVILAVDQTANPYRVEDAQVKEAITTYIDKKTDMRLGSLRATDRQGTFVWDDKTQLVYRTLTTHGLYDFVMTPDESNAFKVNAIYQTHPVTAWKSEEFEEKLPTIPMAMLYFYEQRDVLGDLKTATEDEGVIKTTKGTFHYVFDKNKVIYVKKEDGETILEQKNEYNIPEEAVKYFEKNQDELGKLIETYGYDMDTKKEMYFVKTNKGDYRIDDYRDGNIDLMKMEIKQ